MAADIQPAYAPGRILVKTTGRNMANVHAQLNTRVIHGYKLVENLELVQIPPELSVEQAVNAFKNSGLVEYAEPDHVYHLAVTNPNDPRFTDGTLWNLDNTGQNGGTADADIDAPEAWDVRTSAANVIVAVIDTGIRYDHEDLAANMWRNMAEVNGASGVDDDGNGYIDDIYGIMSWSYTSNNIIYTVTSSNPMDDHGHGSHVSGIIGAVGNNSVGVAGVAWNVQLMALKIFNSSGGGGYVSDILKCIDYAAGKGAHIINASWGGAVFNSSLRQAISKLRNHNMLFVAAAGNYYYDDLNNDRAAYYPASYDVDNIVAVMATTRNDTVPWWSHYGQIRVHLAAPGNDIYSCWATTISSYANDSGTSMSAPHVSGAMALLKREFEFESYLELKNRLLSSADRLGALAGLCQTEGRLNLDRALRTTWPARPPNDHFATAFTLVRPPSGQITAVANNVNASEEVGEPDHAGNAGGKSVWWNWTAPDTTTVTIKTEGSGFNTLLAVYTGTTVNNLTFVAADNDSCQCGTSQVTFTPTQGTTYRIAVDGHNGAQGSIKLTIQNGTATPPVSLQFVANTAQRPQGQFTVSLTGPASATVTIQRSGDDAFSWDDSAYATVNLNGSGQGTFTDASAPVGAKVYRAIVTTTGQRSCNAVGYVDFSGITANASTLVGNPLNRGGNTVAEVFPSAPEGTILSKWNESSGLYDIATFEDGAWVNPTLVLNPGQGLYYQNPTGSPLTHTFVGEVPQGYLVNSVNNGWTMRSSMVPQAGWLSSQLLFPVMDGNNVYKTENGTLVQYSFQNGAWSPAEPVINIGEAFWSYKGVGFWWSRNFQVWP